MYSVVLATMLTAGGTAPDWHGCGGCRCWCSGCFGNAFSGCRCCGGCWGCSGCRGCFGCSGGCWGCSGCLGGGYGGVGGYGGYGSACFGCSGCAGCACYGCGAGCWGYAGGGAVVQPAPGPGAPAPSPRPQPIDKKRTEAAPARITVHVPADAKVTVDGVECPLTSGARTFDTPKLQPGQQFYYTVQAEVVRDGKTRTETKRVIFEAGRKIDVEFSLPVETASR